MQEVTRVNDSLGSYRRWVLSFRAHGETRNGPRNLDRVISEIIALAQKGKLQALRQGRFWRFREADVTAYKKRMEKVKAKES